MTYTLIKTSELRQVLDALQYTQSEESSRCICCGSRYECIKGCAVVSAAKVISAATRRAIVRAAAEIGKAMK